MSELSKFSDRFRIAQRYRDLVSGQKKGPVAVVMRGVLYTASLVSKQIIARRNRRYDDGSEQICKVDVPVVCVGNLTMGGTGKTPMVHYLATWFRDHDQRVAIVSRGYGADEGQQNDEAKELAERLPAVPHLQNPDRVAAATVAVDELEMQVLVLDDGFQHRRLARDLDIVLLDALDPFGCDYVVPRGMLREPLTGMRRAQIVALSRADLITPARRDEIRQRVLKLHPSATWLELAHVPTRLLGGPAMDDAQLPGGEKLLAGVRVLAFCGLGNPIGFRRTLEACGADVIGFREFPDHHPYTRDDVEALRQWSEEHKPAMLVCTHKDFVKIELQQIGQTPLRALLVELKVIQGEEELHRHLSSLLDLLSSS